MVELLLLTNYSLIYSISTRLITLLIIFTMKKEFNVEQPFKFMEQIAVETKGNFFESRTVEYQKAKLNETLSFTDDF